MKCEKCGVEIHGADIYQFDDKHLCDDCFIDMASGVPQVDISDLPQEFQAGFNNIMKRWNRDRPNRHHIAFHGFGEIR